MKCCDGWSYMEIYLGILYYLVILSNPNGGVAVKVLCRCGERHNQLTLSWLSLLIWVGLIQLVEGLKSKHEDSWLRHEILPVGCSVVSNLKTTTSATWVSSLPAFPTDVNLANSLNHRPISSILLKLSSSIYHQTMSFRFCFSGEPEYRWALLFPPF